jgi:hypothetical protein
VYNLLNVALKILLAPIISRNKEFENLYEGMDCYIFGNGISLKWYNLEKFANKKTITCNWLYLHKQIDSLELVADIELHPFYYYPYWKNTYSGKWVKNPITEFSRSSGKFNQEFPIFVSASNYLALWNYPNVRYLHNFGERNPDAGILDLASTFSWMKGALYAMLGIAAFMGFKKITLVGMDYLYDIVMGPHFYENGTGYRKELDAEKKDSDLIIFQQLKNKFDIDIELMLPREAISSHFPTVYYSDVFSVKEKYRNNDVLVESKNLKVMSSLGLGYSI